MKKYLTQKFHFSTILGAIYGIDFSNDDANKNLLPLLRFMTQKEVTQLDLTIALKNCRPILIKQFKVFTEADIQLKIAELQEKIDRNLNERICSNQIIDQWLKEVKLLLECTEYLEVKVLCSRAQEHNPFSILRDKFIFLR